MTTATKTRTVVTSLAALRDAVKVVRTGVASRPPVAILGCLILQSGPDGLTMRGFDYHTDVTVQVVPEPGPEWSVAVSWAWLNSVVHALGKSGTRKATAALPVTLEPKDLTIESRYSKEVRSSLGLLISGDGWEFTIPIGGPVEDFPPADEVKYTDDHWLTSDRDVLLAAVERAAACAGDDDTLPMLTGVHFTVAGGHLSLAGTDRFRLGVAELDAKTSENDWTALIPARTLVNLLRSMPSGPVSITSHVSDSRTEKDRWSDRELRFVDQRVRIDAVGATAQLKCIDREFVTYRTLLPADSTTKIEINRRALLTAIDRAKIACDRGHHLTIEVGADGIQLKSGSDDSGKAVGPLIPAVGTREPLLIAFNPYYLAAGLAQFKSETVCLAMNTPARPIVISETPVDAHANDSSYRYLVMPARLP